MVKTSTRTRSKEFSHDCSKPRSVWGAERTLLVAILIVGLVGLVAVYSGHEGSHNTPSASLTDTVQHSGKLKTNHMILKLNQRSHQRRSSTPKSSRF